MAESSSNVDEDKDYELYMCSDHPTEELKLDMRTEKTILYRFQKSIPGSNPQIISRIIFPMEEGAIRYKGEDYIFVCLDSTPRIVLKYHGKEYESSQLMEIVSNFILPSYAWFTTSAMKTIFLKRDPEFDHFPDSLVHDILDNTIYERSEKDGEIIFVPTTTPQLEILISN